MVALHRVCATVSVGLSQAERFTIEFTFTWLPTLFPFRLISHLCKSTDNVSLRRVKSARHTSTRQPNEWPSDRNAIDTCCR